MFGRTLGPHLKTKFKICLRGDPAPITREQIWHDSSEGWGWGLLVSDLSFSWSPKDPGGPKRRFRTASLAESPRPVEAPLTTAGDRSLLETNLPLPSRSRRRRCSSRPFRRGWTNREAARAGPCSEAGPGPAGRPASEVHGHPRPPTAGFSARSPRELQVDPSRRRSLASSDHAPAVTRSGPNLARGSHPIHGSHPGGSS
jgi:hypothetical protein